MDPQQSVKGGGDREDGVRLANVAIDLLEAREETRHGGRADSDVTADLDVLSAELAGDDAEALPGGWIFDLEEIFRQQCA